MRLKDDRHKNWPTSDAEAAARANTYRDHDPFPRVRPALLGSEDFLNYARVTGMIYPCEGYCRTSEQPKKGMVKPASYEVRPGKTLFIWDSDGNFVQKNLADSDSGFIRLPANSITFVSTNETFRLPNYIALGFNLRIKHVHRGILLGTGPLADPGFGKEILIPLHNLTDEEYVISLNEGLIWVEFTKTSWQRTGPSDSKSDHDVSLPQNTEKDFREFLLHANGGRPIQSSIPVSIRNAEDAAKRAEARAKALENQIRGFGIVAIIVLVLTVASVLTPVFGLVQDTSAVLADSQRANADLREDVDRLERQLNSLAASDRSARQGTSR